MACHDATVKTCLRLLDGVALTPSTRAPEQQVTPQDAIAAMH